MTDIPRPAAAAPAAPAKVMGRFRCEQRITADPWLETWRARVQGLGGFDRLFALLCLTPGALARRPHAAESLLRAARSTAAIKDARVASVHDSGLAPGSAFVARELVHGISLRDLEQHLHGGTAGVGTAPPPLPAGFPGVLAHVAAEIAAALAVAHAPPRGLAHGALGPTAIMVTPQGGIKLIDFGLRASVLAPQEIAASPVHGPYAAPELAGGEVTIASDVYALGRVVAGLGGGGSPRRGADAIRALPGILQTTVRHLLAEDPRQRPTAVQAEQQLRLAAREVRGVDVTTELGRLVRMVMQVQASRPQPPEEAAAAADRQEEAMAAPAPTELFADEPTAILAVSPDGSPTPLASLLRDLRQQTGDDDESTDRTAIPFGVRLEKLEAHHAPTPLQGLPAVNRPPVSAAFEFDTPTVMTSAANLPLSQPPPPRQARTPVLGNGGVPPSPVPASASGPVPRIIQVLPKPAARGTPKGLPLQHPASPSGSAGPARSTPSRPMSSQGSGPLLATGPSPTVGPPPVARTGAPATNGSRNGSSGTPVAELTNLTTEEISASFSAPIERPFHGEDQGGVPEPLSFRGFSTAVATDGQNGTMTPASWEPPGNLDAGGLGGERPGSLGGIEIPSRRRPRHLLTLAVGGVAVVAVAAAALLLTRGDTARAPAPSAPTPVAGNAPAETPAPGPSQRGAAYPTAANVAAATAPVPSGPAPAPGPAPESGQPTTAVIGPAPKPAASRPMAPRAAPRKAVASEPATAREATAREATAREATTREIEVHSTPPGATVVVAGLARGVTPLRLEIATDAPELKLVRPGYEPKTVPLGPDTGKLVEAALTPVQEPPPR